ncbi:MAG: ribonuclease HII [Thermoflexales bacterium]|nr:ribonuclease HII [Thermoflexales bacterium]
MTVRNKPPLPEQPTLDHEDQLRQAGHALVAGIDEAGRGAWAGPVVAAAVILDHRKLDQLDGVNDSKQLSPRQREALYQLIVDNCRAFGVGHGSVDEIDSIGIVPATRLAMTRAIEALSPQPNALIIDAVRLPKVNLPQSVFFFADSISLSVAAASIIAKVSRDRLMVELSAHYPRYDFARHKGYGTRIHQVALQSIGPCEIHRRSFKPISTLLADRLI